MEVIVLIVLALLQIILFVMMGIDLSQNEIRLPVVVTYNVLYLIIPVIVMTILPAMRATTYIIETANKRQEHAHAGQLRFTMWFYFMSAVAMLFQTWIHLWATNFSLTPLLTGDDLFFKSSLALAWVFAILNLENFYTAIFIHSIVLF